MPTCRLAIALHKTVQRRHVARWPETSGAVAARRNHSPEPWPLDWDHAVRIAAARLAEQYVMPDTAIHPLLREQAEWLAALLTAFGELAEVVDHLHAHADGSSVSKQNEPSFAA